MYDNEMIRYVLDIFLPHSAVTWDHHGSAGLPLGNDALDGSIPISAVACRKDLGSAFLRDSFLRVEKKKTRSVEETWLRTPRNGA